MSDNPTIGHARFDAYPLTMSTELPDAMATYSVSRPTLYDTLFADLRTTQAKLAIALQALHDIHSQTDTSAGGKLMKWWDTLRAKIKRVDHSGPRDDFEFFMEEMHATAGEALANIK